MSRDPMDPTRTEMRRRLPNDIENLPAPPSRRPVDPRTVLANSTLLGPAPRVQNAPGAPPPALTAYRGARGALSGARDTVASLVAPARAQRIQQEYNVPGQDAAGPGTDRSPDPQLRRLAAAGGRDARVIYKGKDAQGNSVYSDEAFDGAEAQVRGALGTRADRAFDPNGVNGYGASLAPRATLEALRAQQGAFDNMAPQVEARQQTAMADLLAQRYGAETAEVQSRAGRLNAQAQRDLAQAQLDQQKAATGAIDVVSAQRGAETRLQKEEDARLDEQRNFGMDRVKAIVDALGENGDAAARRVGLNNARDLAIVQALGQMVNEYGAGDPRIGASGMLEELTRIRSDLARGINNEQGQLSWGQFANPFFAADAAIEGAVTGQNRAFPWDARETLGSGLLRMGEDYNIEDRANAITGRKRPTLVVGGEEGRAVRLSEDDPRQAMLLQTLEIARRFQPQE